MGESTFWSFISFLLCNHPIPLEMIASFDFTATLMQVCLC